MTQFPGFSRAMAVTKADADQAFTFTQKALYVGGTGDVKVRTSDGDDVTLTAVPVGVILPVQVKRVFSTGTTATLIVALGD